MLRTPPSLSWLDACPVYRTGDSRTGGGKATLLAFPIQISSLSAPIAVPNSFLLVLHSVWSPLPQSATRSGRSTWTRPYAPEVWATIARGTGSTKTPEPRIARPGGPKPAPRGLPPNLDHAYCIKRWISCRPGERKPGTLFSTDPWKSPGSVREDTFTRVQKTLEDVLLEPVS